MKTRSTHCCLPILELCLFVAVGVGTANGANEQDAAALANHEAPAASSVVDDDKPDPRIVKLVSKSKLDGITTEHGMNIVRLWGRDGRGQTCIIKLAPVESEGEECIFVASIVANRQDVPKEIVKGLMNMNTIRRKFIWCDLAGHLAFRVLVPLNATPEEFRKDAEFVAIEADAVERVYLQIDAH